MEISGTENKTIILISKVECLCLSDSTTTYAHVMTAQKYLLTLLLVIHNIIKTGYSIG